MSIKINLIPGTTLTEEALNSAADRAIRGFKDEAIKKFEESGLNQEQMLKVTEIIKTVNSDSSIVELANLKDRILDDLTKQSTPEIVVPEKTTFADCIVSKDMIPDNQWFGCFTALPDDVMTTIFMTCFHTGRPERMRIQTLAMVCKGFYQKIIGPNSFVEQLSLEQLCPGLTILDLDQENVLKFAKYDKFQILKAYNRLLSQYVLGKRGVTLIAMPQGLTLVNLLDQAVKEEAAVNRMTYKDNKNFKRISCFDSSQESSYLVLIVDSGFSSSFYDAKDISHEERYALDEVRCALKGCELPRLEELLALHIFRPDLAQEPRRGSVFWSCSNTFSLGKKSAWGIEHYISEDNYRDGFTTIQICTYDQSLRPYSFEPPHSCQGVIRFSPSKK